MSDEAVTVEQVDKDAAEPFQRPPGWLVWSIAQRASWGFALVQAFARHRHASTRDLAARLAKAEEALRAIAGNGDGTGCNPQLMVDRAREALGEKP